MLRLVALSLLLCSVAVAEEVKVQVLRDGKPAKGATVRLATTTFIEHKPVSEMSKPAMVDDVGSATIQLPVEYFTFTIYANDESGLFAASRSLAKSYGPIPAVIRLDLAKPATCSGRIVDPTGKPIQGLELTLRAARNANPKDSDEEHFQYIRLDPLDGSTVKTDEHGRYKFAIVPVGWHATVEFRSAKFGRGLVRLDSKENKDVVLAEAGSLKLVFDHADAKPSQFNFSLRSSKEDSKTLGVVQGTSIVEPGKESGSYVNIVPGTYTFQSDRGATSPRIPDWSKSVEIKPGAETVFNIKTTAAVVISGRVVEKSTGKGIPDARIAVQGLKAYVFEVAVTDKEGRYTCRVPGDNQYSLYSYENFRAGERNFEVPAAFKNSRKRPDGFQTDMLQPGAKHEFPTLELREALTIRGKVKRTDKKPFSGVCNVEYAVSGSSDHATVPKWDGAMFTLPGMPHDSGITLRLRQGNAVNVPERMDADKLKEEVTYSISEANAVTITGKVLDQKERGLAGVKVQLTTTRPVEGSMERSLGGSNAGSMMTDKNGVFTFTGCWPNEQYHITAEDPRFGKVGDNINGSRSAGPGRTLDFGTFTVKIPEKTITGTVLHVDGTPVAGATVQTTGDTPKTMTTTTDDKGKFEIRNLPNTKLFVTATKAGYRHTYAPCDTAKGTVTLVLRKQSEDPAPMKSEDLDVKRKNATHEMLEMLWVTRADHNRGPSAFGYAMRFNETLAQKWTKEATGKEADGLKAQLAANLTNDELVALAVKDVDEAIRKVKAKRSDCYDILLKVADGLVPTDKAKALRLVEESLSNMRASQNARFKPGLAANLASTATVLHRAGKEGDAKKLFAEALALVEECEKDPKDQNSRSWVAEQLAKVDLPAAIEQFKKIKDDSYHDSAITRLLVLFAKTNPQLAVDNLKLIRSGSGPHSGYSDLCVAMAIAYREPEKAMKLVDRITFSQYRVQGYMELAKKLRGKNEALAWGLIDKAFDELEKDTKDFQKSINSGSNPAAAAQIASVARQINHPDVHSLVARTLAYRVKDEHHVDSLDTELHYFLMGLSIADPESVRWMLQPRYTEDELLQQSTGGRRNLLFILAMVDPALCRKAVELYVADIKKLRGFGQSGIIEMLGSLTMKGEEFESLGAWQALFFGKLDRE